MIAPVLIVVAVLCAMVPTAFVVGRSVGRVGERRAVVQWLAEAGRETYRTSWIVAAKVIRIHMPQRPSRLAHHVLTVEDMLNTVNAMVALSTRNS